MTVYEGDDEAMVQNTPTEAVYQERRQQWIDALLSGKYAQTQEYLRIRTEGNDAYCCLGVLSDLCPTIEWDEGDDDGDVTQEGGLIIGARSDRGNHSDTILIDEGYGWLGYSDVADRQFIGALIEANDDGEGFESIAERIAVRHGLSTQDPSKR